MLGTLVNALAIIGGSIVGFIFRTGIPEKVNETVMKGLSLCVLLIGIINALKLESNQLLLLIFAIVIGGILGEVVDIDKRLQDLGNHLEARLKGKGGRVSEGFVTASLVYCIGAMAIVGALESGLKGNNEILFAKSIIDGISAVVFTTSMGIGVALAGISVFLYEGIIALAASSLSGLLTNSVINAMSSIGGLLIIGIALNMMGVTKIKVANLLPAVFIPIFYQLALNIWPSIQHLFY